MSASETPPRRPFELVRERDGARLRPDESATARPAEAGGDGRVGAGRLGRGRSGAPRAGEMPGDVRPWEEETAEAERAQAVPRRLGEVLLSARLRRGVDLERAQRDTKIRARYLAALEAGDFRELPGTVYTKGFLRNYAQYLELDPDAIVDLYRREYGARASEPVTVVPRVLEAPRRRITLSSGLLIAGVLTVIVLGFAAYIGIQLFRFAKPPELLVTSPAQANSEIDADSLAMSGTTSPRATVTITGPDGVPLQVSADAEGRWGREVPLRKGRNEFQVVASDPATAKSSETLTLVVTVPIPVIVAPTLSLTSPNDGTSFTNGAIPVQGTTSGSKVVVAALWAGPLQPPAEGEPTPEPPAAPDPKELVVEGDGSFGGSYDLTAGRWRLTVTATGEENRQTRETREIEVVYTGVNLVVEVRSERAWLRVRVDGAFDPKTGGEGGITFRPGAILTFSAEREIQIRSGVPRATYVTVNGIPYGPLGEGPAGTWLIGPSGPPQPVD